MAADHLVIQRARALAEITNATAKKEQKKTLQNELFII